MGRCMPLFPIGRCTPALFLGPDERCVFIVWVGRCAPTPKPGRPPTLALPPSLPRIPEAVPMRLTTGRAKLRGGGAAALILAFEPSIAVLVGFTSKECIGLIRLS